MWEHREGRLDGGARKRGSSSPLHTDPAGAEAEGQSASDAVGADALTLEAAVEEAESPSSTVSGNSGSCRRWRIGCHQMVPCPLLPMYRPQRRLQRRTALFPDIPFWSEMIDLWEWLWEVVDMLDGLPEWELSVVHCVFEKESAPLLEESGYCSVSFPSAVGVC